MSEPMHAPATSPQLVVAGRSTANMPQVADQPPDLTTQLKQLIESVDQQLAPDAGEFVGRGFVQNLIDRFLIRKPKNRALVLVGPPGFGKTALAVQRVREHLHDPLPWLAHFCSLPDGENPKRFCQSLGDQVRALLGSDYQARSVFGRQLQINQEVKSDSIGNNAVITGASIKQVVIGDVHPREAFRVLVREPLLAYETTFFQKYGQQAQLFLVIDALDLVWQWDGSQSTNMISVFEDIQSLPIWVKLICFARPGPAVQALRTQAGVCVLPLLGESKEEQAAAARKNDADILAYLREQFLGGLSAEAQTRLDGLLAQATPAIDRDSLLTQVCAVSQGNFSYIRRYVGAWRQALNPVAGQPVLDPQILLDLRPENQLAVLELAYRVVAEQIMTEINSDEGDTDIDVMAVLATAFTPLTIEMIMGLTEASDATMVRASLARLAPVLTVEPAEQGESYRFYHRDFAAYIRSMLVQKKDRKDDMRIAQLLEQNINHPVLRQYAARYRWSHLVRGLGTQNRNRVMPAQVMGGVGVPGAPNMSLDWRRGVDQVRQISRDSVTQSQLLRLLAAQALDPSEADIQGSWAAALHCLREAEKLIQSSRAITRMSRYGWRADQRTPSPEMLELEQIMIAKGDAYRVIAQRMDAGGRQFDDWVAERRGIYLLWDVLSRLPLTIYLLLMLVRQGVRDLQIPGVLENLGRGQDWAIARLYVSCVTAYRRARTMAYQRGDDDQVQNLTEQLARTYMLMGAYDAAAADYEMLLNRPSALESPWRKARLQHALGDVWLAQRRIDSAVDMLKQSLVQFHSTDTPVLGARAQSSLAQAHAMQADLAEQRGELQEATRLDNETIADCRAALIAWNDVTDLQGNEGASIDPMLAKSQIGHLLWRLTQNQRLLDSQVGEAQDLHKTITERHFPQRFEHPLLRLFRVVATVLVPATILFGLMLVVQSPSTFLVDTRTALSLQPPLIDLGRFPNNLISGASAQPSSLSVADLTKLLADSGWRQFEPSPPQLRVPTLSLGTVTLIAVQLFAIYLLLYLVTGLLIIRVASPTSHQVRRPGRLILTPKELIWSGQRPLGIWRDTMRLGLYELERFWYGFSQRVMQIVGQPTIIREPQRPPQAMRVELKQIERAVTLDRRERGRLLGDFSLTQIEVAAVPAEVQERTRLLARFMPGGATAARIQSFSIPGSIVFYDELCAELELRLRMKSHRFTVELVRSVSGFIFAMTLVYITLMALLGAIQPQLLQQPLPALGYSLSDLYVLVAPGLMIPLIWWFIAQPLQARTVRARRERALGATAVAGGLLSSFVLLGGDSINLLDLQPDLFTPVLALGLMTALAIYGPPRPLRQAFRLRRELIGTLLALVAVVLSLSLLRHMFMTIDWYDSLVRGNLAMRAALTDENCVGTGDCPAFDQAIREYSDMICLRPGSSDGYAFRGLAHIAQQRYQLARLDFYAALEAAKGKPQPFQPEGRSCEPLISGYASNARIAGLHGNLGAASTLAARQVEDLESATALYREANYHFLHGLTLSQPLLNGGLAQQILSSDDQQALECATIARQLLLLNEDGAGNQYLTKESAEVLVTYGDTQLRYMLQLADACYSSGFSRARSISGSSLDTRDSLRLSAWRDLSAAVNLYEAVEMVDQQYLRASHGKADAWLILGQFDPLPPGTPDRHSYLIRALNTYTQLSAVSDDDAVFAGQAWSIILLGGWSDAVNPLAQAETLAPANPTYPALRGLIDWLDSTRYRQPVRTAPSPDYSSAILSAIEHYNQVIDLSTPPTSQMYATRSVLYYSLRNSPQAGVAAYFDPDYGRWMRLALADMDRAIELAAIEQLPSDQQVGYRYWRGRVAFSLALTWQRKLRGLHSWGELVPLYTLALDDFQVGFDNDSNANRRREYQQLRIPWAAYMANNAVHLSQAEQAIRADDYETARREFELVQPLLSEAQRRQWDQYAEPRPEYAMTHILLSLGLNMPEDLVNQQIGKSMIDSSVDSLLASLRNSTIVDPSVRDQLAKQYVAELERQIESGALSPEATSKALEIIERLEP